MKKYDPDEDTVRVRKMPEPYEPLKIDYTKGDNWRRGLCEAACVIQKQGWISGSLCRTRTIECMDTGEIEQINGPVCWMGAINTVTSGNPGRENDAGRHLRHKLEGYLAGRRVGGTYVGSDDCGVEGVNDSFLTSQSAAIRILRNASKNHERKKS